MTGWRHGNQWHSDFTGATYCMAPRDNGSPCECTTPTPDPTSPCGFEGCASNHAQTLHAIHRFQEQTCWHVPEVWCHPHVPTRCLCGHAIEPEP